MRHISITSAPPRATCSVCTRCSPGKAARFERLAAGRRAAAISPRWWQRRSPAGGCPPAACTACQRRATAARSRSRWSSWRRTASRTRGCWGTTALPADAARRRLHALCHRPALRAQRTRRRCGSWPRGRRGARLSRSAEVPGRVEFSVADARSGAPLDARHHDSAEGEKPLVRVSSAARLSSPSSSARVVRTSTLAPGELSVHGLRGRRIPAPRSRGATLSVASGRFAARAASRSRALFDPRARGWYAADLHHHADQAEAVTPPRTGPLAAGRRTRCAVRQRPRFDGQSSPRCAPSPRARAVPFIPGSSCRPPGATSTPTRSARARSSPSTPAPPSIDTILEEARREGARWCRSITPSFPTAISPASMRASPPAASIRRSISSRSIPSVPDDDPKVLARMWAFWNAGQRYYLSAGSDTHDVWNEESGRVRTYVHPDGPLSTRAVRGGAEGGARLRDLRTADIPVGDVRHAGCRAVSWQPFEARLRSRSWSPD